MSDNQTPPSVVVQEVHERSIAILVAADDERMNKLVFGLACKYPHILCELHDGYTMVESLEERVKELIRSDKKVNAIKLYRDETGLGLRESKYFVDNLEY